MEEKPPSDRMLIIGGIFWLILSLISVLVWSYFSPEWWSPVILAIAVFFFVEGIAHMNVYAIMADISEAPEEKD